MCHTWSTTSKVREVLINLELQVLRAETATTRRPTISQKNANDNNLLYKGRFKSFRT